MTVNTVTISVSSMQDSKQRAAAAFRGKEQGARISYASEDLLWRTITPKRWALLKAMVDQGPLAIREIARRVKRDVRAVHSNVHALLKAGWYFPTRRFMWTSGCERLDTFLLKITLC